MHIITTFASQMNYFLAPTLSPGAPSTSSLNRKRTPGSLLTVLIHITISFDLAIYH